MILILFGPTAVGKTDYASMIAQMIPVEIINMDVGQLYTPLTIGTAKPDWRHASVPHHLFDVLDEPRHFTVVEYRQRVMELIKEIRARHATPLLVGGSAFYLFSLFFPPQEVASDSTMVTDESEEDATLWQRLYEIDPERAHTLHPSDSYRIKRALMLWQSTGKKPSERVPMFKSLSEPCIAICLIRERVLLYERINKRVNIMMQQGWLNEVAHLQHTAWHTFLQQKKLIGYPELLQYLEDPDQMSLIDVIAHIQQKTRNYAKRQLTFWRRFERHIKKLPESDRSEVQCETLDLTHSDQELYIKQLLQRHELL